MLAKFENWVRTFSSGSEAVPQSADEWAETVAGLLVEAAMADGQLGDEERHHIARMLMRQLGLDEVAVDAVIARAVAGHDERIEIHTLTRAIRAETEAEERITIMEMIWMVVLADGVVHDYEAQLMRRLAGLLFVDDVDSGKAQKRARARLDEGL